MKHSKFGNPVGAFAEVRFDYVSKSKFVQKVY